MDGTFRRLTVIAAMLALAAFCMTARAADAQSLRMDARDAAADELIKTIRALPLGDDTVGALLDNAVTGVKKADLLAGVEEEVPARYFAKNECEVVLRLSVKDLKANVAAIVGKQGETVQSMYKDKAPVVDGEYLTVTGKFAQPLPWQEMQKGTQGTPDLLDGWDDADAIDRVKAERVAYDAAKAQLSSGISALLKDAEAVKLIVAAARPSSKAYMTGGVCEVTIKATASDLINQAGDKLVKADADKAAKTLRDKAFDIVGLAGLNGKGVEADGLFTWQALKSTDIVGLVPVEKKPVEEVVPVVDMPADEAKPAADAPAEKTEGKTEEGQE